MNSSLDKLVNNLEPNQFKHVRQKFCDEQCEPLLCNDVFPYRCFDSFEKLGESKLPTKEAFYSS